MGESLSQRMFPSDHDLLNNDLNIQNRAKFTRAYKGARPH